MQYSVTHRLSEAFPVTYWNHLRVLQRIVSVQPRRTPLLNNFCKDMQKHAITCMFSIRIYHKHSSTQGPQGLEVQSKNPSLNTFQMHAWKYQTWQLLYAEDSSEEGALPLLSLSHRLCAGCVHCRRHFSLHSHSLSKSHGRAEQSCPFFLCSFPLAIASAGAVSLQGVAPFP